MKQISRFLATFAIVAACLLLLAACGSTGEIEVEGTNLEVAGSEEVEADNVESAPDEPEELSPTVTLTARVFDSVEEADAPDAEIRIVIPGYDDEWSDVPVRIAAFADPESGVDELRYLRRSGSDGTLEASFELPRGRYNIGVAAPVVSPDGEAYVMEDALYAGDEYELLADLRRYSGDAGRPPVVRITLAPLMPALVTDEMVERTLVYAESGEANLDRTQANIEALENRRREEQLRGLSERERLALGFVTAYRSTNTPDGIDEYGFTQLATCDREEWLADCMSYLDSGTPLYRYFPVTEAEVSDVLLEDPDAGPFLGVWDAWSVLDSAAVLSSDGDTVTVATTGWGGNGELIANFRELLPLGRPGTTIVTFNSANKIVDVRRGSPVGD